MNPQGDREKKPFKESWRMRRTKIFKLAPIRKRFRYSESASLCAHKSPPHQFQNPQGYRDTTNWVKSADVKKSIILNWVKLKKLLAFRKEDRSLKITVPLPMFNSLWSWRYSTFSKISKIR